MNKIFIFGASEHAKYTIDIIEQEQKHEIAGIFDDNLPKSTGFEGYNVLGKIESLPEAIEQTGVQRGIVAIGDNFTRLRVCKRIIELVPEFEFVSAIHPSVILGKNVKIGEGTLIMAGVVINNDTRLGQHTFIGTQTSIDHDSVLEDFASFSPGCTTGGAVHVGFCSAICLKAGIIHGVKIGSHTVVGAGSIVTRNLGDHLVAYGIPAKKIRDRQEGEPYL